MNAAAASSGSSEEASTFNVPFWLDALGRVVERLPKFWLWWARRETASLEPSLASTPLAMPIYISGLARSGSTLLHEAVASHPSVATHRVRDYPLVFTPYWWRRATAQIPPSAPRERVHRDGVVVNSESPDALEEMIWMAFFPGCHDPAQSNLLGRGDALPAFDNFYRAHLKKILLAETKTRYTAKANYHVARLAYLVQLFPDARFILPIRHPVAHIASLKRQHEWFSHGERLYPRSLAYMRRTGHYEFGLDRRPLNLGDHQRVSQIRDAWRSADEVRGLALYWDMVYSHLALLLETDAEVRSASLTIRFEDVGDAPAETFRRICEHCQLSDTARLAELFAARVRKSPPVHDFSNEEMAVIRDITEATARKWSYQW